MASQALMCDKKAFPNPCPSAAPLTNPAISTTFKNAGTLLKKEKKINVFFLNEILFTTKSALLIQKFL